MRTPYPGDRARRHGAADAVVDGAGSYIGGRDEHPGLNRPAPEFVGPRAQSYSVGATDGSRPGTFQYPVVGVPLTRFGVRTIAYHEAIPGHHFQLALQAEDPSLQAFLRNRVFGGNSAVTEGGAVRGAGRG